MRVIPTAPLEGTTDTATRKQRKNKRSQGNHDTSSSNVGAHGQLVSRRDPSGMKPISETVIIRRSLGNDL